ncbi:MAG: ATP-binding cassette domain-containing protein [Candidatus Aminicenantes bacterium]|nr:ATP-binding cassette domain-containing protein [Candidatus Aminicenantes bacterium]
MGGDLYRLEEVRFAHPFPKTSFALEIDLLRLEAGATLALVGPNGAGKSTLLMILAFLARPGRGRLVYRGGNPWASESDLVAARREAVLVTHHPYLFKGTVGENLAFGLKLRKVPETDWPRRVGAALDLVELQGRERADVRALSAGQVQRTALARAIVLKPRVLLLDEPTAALDAALGLRIEAVLGELGRQAGTTVVFSTHDFSQANRLGDDIFYLSEGRKVEYSHVNCFSGTAATDGRLSWIEPKPGIRIVFPGERRGHVTCVVDPARVAVRPANGPPAEAGTNVFGGRITRMDLIGPASALLRVSGDLTFRATVPMEEVSAKGLSLSKAVLLEFKPESVEVGHD